MTTQPVRVRIAPSPTGYFHLGGARTALYNFLFARHNGGRFILRIEDTDRTRYHPEAISDLLESLRWLGLWWDEGPEIGGEYGPYYQSDRLPLYQEYAAKLVQEGHAYRCYCSPERLASLRAEQRGQDGTAGYDRHCRFLTSKQIADYEARGIRPVIRLAVPLEGTTTFTDALRGDIVVQNSQLDDLVLLKSDGFPTYHLGVVVDDHLMAISHVIRGEEWLSSSPKHVLLYQALGWEMPVHAHLPVILDPSGKGKLSKRKKKDADGQEQLTYIHEFREEGYLPEAMVNFLALVGWSLDAEHEFFGRDELIRSFDLSRVSKSPGALSYDKLEFMNAAYIRSLGKNDLASRLLPVLKAEGIDADIDSVLAFVPHIQERLKVLTDARDWIDFAYVDEIHYDPTELLQKKLTPAQASALLSETAAAIEALPVFEEGEIEATLRALVEASGLKAREYFGSIRVAVTGKAVAPPLFGSLAILGRERSVSRLRRAVSLLQTLS
ncbi:MAG: glutamate--tRNA ligase [Anaerolineales bacterium]